MVIFNAFLNLNELKELYSGKPVCVCPLYNGVLNTSKIFEATGNPIVIPEYKQLVKLKTKFSPKQAGTGDPSPENIRPISGWDSVKVTVSNESESHDYNITLPETIYCGTVDAVTGEGEKTWEFVEFDGTEIWNITSGGTTTTTTFTTPATAEPLPLTGTFVALQICNVATWQKFNWSGDYPWTISGSQYTGNIYISVPNDVASTVEEWKSYLAAQASAGTPVQVAYKLATPEPFENSQVSIPSLGGENKFFTNGENMDIICNITSFWG